jgi:transposase InsO family protein
VRNRKNASGLSAGLEYEPDAEDRMAPGPNTSRPHPEHPVFPSVLRNLAIVRPDQVWATDMTYIPLERGWAYLVVSMNWFQRSNPEEALPLFVTRPRALAAGRMYAMRPIR